MPMEYVYLACQIVESALLKLTESVFHAVKDST